MNSWNAITKRRWLILVHKLFNKLSVIPTIFIFPCIHRYKRVLFHLATSQNTWVFFEHAPDPDQVLKRYTRNDVLKIVFDGIQQLFISVPRDWLLGTHVLLLKVHFRYDITNQPPQQSADTTISSLYWEE